MTIDLQDALIRDGARWRSELDGPPDLTAMARTTASRRRVPRGLSVAATAAAVALVCVGLGVLLRDRTASVRAPAAISVGGHRIPYAGLVSWSNAIADPTDPRTVYVWADNNVDYACSIAADRPVIVRQGSRDVAVQVAGYTPKSSRTGGCGLVLYSPVRVAVHLEAPLGGRSLVDATTGTTHRVLDPSTVPSIGHVPPACGPTHLTWDEKTGVALRSNIPHPMTITCLFEMAYGPVRAVEKAYPLDGTPTSPVEINGVWAAVTAMNDHLNNDLVSLQWSPRPGRLIQLTVNVNPKHPITEEEVVAVARSIR